MLKLNAKELRTTLASEKDKKQLKKNPIYIICDNILDTYNVGSIFRLADAVGAEKVFLCGITETPPNTRIKKASINTTEWVSWEYMPSAMDAIESLREQFSYPKGNVIPSEYQIPRELSFRAERSEVEESNSRSNIGETDPSTPIRSVGMTSKKKSGFSRMTKGIQIVAIEQSNNSVPFNYFNYQLPIALVVGNETTGISREALELCDAIVELPMFGVNKSLNVMVSLGIILYQVAPKFPLLLGEG